MTRIFAISAAALAAVAVGIASYAAADPRRSNDRRARGHRLRRHADAATSVQRVGGERLPERLRRASSRSPSTRATRPYGGQAAGPGLRLRLRRRRPRHHQRARRRRRERDLGPVLERRHATRRRVVGTDPSTDVAVIKVNAPASMLAPDRSSATRAHVQVGQTRRRDRQPVRPRGDSHRGNRQRPAP